MKKSKDKVNKKILESKLIINEDKKKIKLEKKNIKKKKYEKFKKTKFGSIFDKVFSFAKVDRDSYTFSEILVITICSLVIGAFASFSVFIILCGGKNFFVLSKDLSKFVEVYNTLIENYYDDVDKDKLINSAIDGMVSSVGDTYTGYVDTENTDEFNELVSGIYEGIGCTIQQQEVGIKVIEIFEGSPAQKAGLMLEDIILKVDDKDATKMTADELSKYIKTESSGKIKMVVLRNEEEVEINLVRGKVETPVVNSYIYEKKDNKIGY